MVNVHIWKGPLGLRAVVRCKTADEAVVGLIVDPEQVCMVFGGPAVDGVDHFFWAQLSKPGAEGLPVEGAHEGGRGGEH